MTDRRLRWLTRVAAIFITGPLVSAAQEPVTNLGLPAVSAVGFHGGFAKLERSSDGQEAGLLLDVGWLRGRAVRLQAEVAFLRATLTETVVLEDLGDSTFHGDYFDLSVGASAIWMASTGSKVSPYAIAGFAVHALSSTFGTSELDLRYNTNRFGSHLGAGIRLRLGSSRQALFAEARRVIADEVNRTVVRFGGMVLMGDLHRSTVRIRGQTPN